MTGPSYPGPESRPPGSSPQPPGSSPRPEMGPVTTQFARLDPGPSQRFGVAGSALAVIGAALLIVSFTAVNWFTKGTLGRSHFSDVHQVLNIQSAFAAGLAKAYFGWLAWVLLAVTVVIALLANAPSPFATALRVIGALAAAASIALTFLAINLLKSGVPGAPSYSEYIKHARVGFWMAIAGFLLVGVGALIGPRRGRG
ncbi:MAG: hypothetical protein JWO57_866 [Pseudonocardiales bacterium]|nr:hypothetical protein [Pseudonocardiales bacterium]